MRCGLYQRAKTDRKVMSDKETEKIVSDFFAEKLREYKVRDYIRSQSFDEEDYNKKLAEYKATGKLPEKIF